MLVSLPGVSAEALTQFSKALNAGKDGKMAKAKVQRNKRNAFGGVIKEVWILYDVLLTNSLRDYSYCEGWNYSLWVTVSGGQDRCRNRSFRHTLYSWHVFSPRAILTAIA